MEAAGVNQRTRFKKSRHKGRARTLNPVAALLGAYPAGAARPGGRPLSTAVGPLTSRKAPAKLPRLRFRGLCVSQRTESSFPSACFYGTTIYGEDKCGTKEKARPASDWQGHPSWRAMAPVRACCN